MQAKDVASGKADVAMETAPCEPQVLAEEMPFTEEELSNVLKILDVLAKRKELLEQSNFRLLRKKLAPVP